MSSTIISTTSSSCVDYEHYSSQSEDCSDGIPRPKSTLPFYGQNDTLVYYAEVLPPSQKKQARQRKCKRNCFAKAFQWYVQDRTPTPKPKIPPELSGFASWLDEKYMEYLRESEAESQQHETSTYEQPCLPCSDINDQNCRIKKSRMKTPWCKRKCQKEIQELNTCKSPTGSCHFILQPRAISQTAVECCPAATPSCKISIVKTQSIKSIECQDNYASTYKSVEQTQMTIENISCQPSCNINSIGAKLQKALEVMQQEKPCDSTCKNKSERESNVVEEIQKCALSKQETVISCVPSCQNLPEQKTTQEEGFTKTCTLPDQTEHQSCKNSSKKVLKNEIPCIPSCQSCAENKSSQLIGLVDTCNSVDHTKCQTCTKETKTMQRNEITCSPSNQKPIATSCICYGQADKQIGKKTKRHETHIIPSCQDQREQESSQKIKIDDPCINPDNTQNQTFEASQKSVIPCIPTGQNDPENKSMHKKNIVCSCSHCENTQSRPKTPQTPEVPCIPTSQKLPDNKPSQKIETVDFCPCFDVVDVEYPPKTQRNNISEPCSVINVQDQQQRKIVRKEISKHENSVTYSCQSLPNHISDYRYIEKKEDIQIANSLSCTKIQDGRKAPNKTQEIGNVELDCCQNIRYIPEKPQVVDNCCDKIEQSPSQIDSPKTCKEIPIGTSKTPKMSEPCDCNCTCNSASKTKNLCPESQKNDGVCARTCIYAPEYKTAVHTQNISAKTQIKDIPCCPSSTYKAQPNICKETQRCLLKTQKMFASSDANHTYKQRAPSKFQIFDCPCDSGTYLPKSNSRVESQNISAKPQKKDASCDSCTYRPELNNVNGETDRTATQRTLCDPRCTYNSNLKIVQEQENVCAKSQKIESSCDPICKYFTTIEEMQKTSAKTRMIETPCDSSCKYSFKYNCVPEIRDIPARSQKKENFCSINVPKCRTKIQNTMDLLCDSRYSDRSACKTHTETQREPSKIQMICDPFCPYNPNSQSLIDIEQTPAKTVITTVTKTRVPPAKCQNADDHNIPQECAKTTVEKVHSYVKNVNITCQCPEYPLMSVKVQSQCECLGQRGNSSYVLVPESAVIPINVQSQCECKPLASTSTSNSPYKCLLREKLPSVPAQGRTRFLFSSQTTNCNLLRNVSNPWKLNRRDDGVQTSDHSINFDNDPGHDYAFFMRIVCADKLLNDCMCDKSF